MPDELATYLLAHGPQMSGEVAAAMAEIHGISAAAARKRIERRDGSVRALNLRFPRGAQFLYVEKQYGSPRFWRKLADALVASNGAYARAIWALSARGGVMPLAHFAAAAGASSGPRQISGDIVRERLVVAGLLQEIQVPGLGACIAFRKGDTFIDDLLPPVRARLIAETVLLQSVREWAAKLGLGSFHSFVLRSEAPNMAPVVGSFAWDLSAPSYLGPLANWGEKGKPKPGFLVVDVLLTDQVDTDDVRPFIYKCTSLRQLPRVGRCLQFFVAHRYSKDALDKIRKAGIVPATSESLFGTDVAQALMELTRTLTQAATSAVDPGKFAELFDRLGRVEGAAGTLRGALFEFVVAEVVRKTTPSVDITLNKIYRTGGKDVAEVDVRAIVKDREVRFIECKGLLPGNRLSDKEVDEWLNKRIPLVRAHTLENTELQHLKLKFEMWLTGNLSPEAQRKIEATRQAVAPQKYTLELVRADDLERQVRLTNDASLLKVVKQHFLAHPLASGESVVNPPNKRRIRRDPFSLSSEQESHTQLTSVAPHVPTLPAE
ncbi:hypothetical protein Q2T91_09385 [Ralstonia pseudosolanacearum]|uniref:hypothetical protein n=1 Tax=Ralstonia pseudosolanacearum TaxID=1310165 RepID=UPI00156E8E00|nr:hypothetical protein HI814_01435 [Ralstonia solanacearum]QKM31503.1 hypothetical protein HI794_01435 [Ralstonia solanacearum]QKM36484.1 hypothetical protein HI793_01435 [Ralstonia solanacearum]